MTLNHYTSVDGLMGILKSEHINFRATRYSHLNDSKEYRWIKDKIPKIEKQLCECLGITFDPDLHTFPYVICFTSLSDDHLMWKLYGSDGKGFMLTFDWHELYKFAINPHRDWNNPDHLQSITYANDTDWKEKFLKSTKLFNNIEEISHSSDIDKVCAYIKRDIWKHENETRYLRPIHDMILMGLEDGKVQESYDGEDYSAGNYRASQYGITPYIDVNIPKHLLKSITIGYGYNFQSQRDALNLLLKSRGYNDVEIIESTIQP